MKELSFIHDYIIILIFFLSIWILYLNVIILRRKIPLKILWIKNIEFYWSIIPLTLIILIAIPSINLTFLINLTHKSNLTVKILGHQWYWRYEFKNFEEKEILSYINNKRYPPLLKFLEVDNKLFLPYKIFLCLIIRRSDVIHSWTIQSLGIKIDAIPGHLNQINILINRPGIFYGQCSEICGSNHSHIPICLESINIKDFLIVL